jgi:hypothetical protein
MMGKKLSSTFEHLAHAGCPVERTQDSRLTWLTFAVVGSTAANTTASTLDQDNLSCEVLFGDTIFSSLLALPFTPH